MRSTRRVQPDADALDAALAPDKSSDYLIGRRLAFIFVQFCALNVACAAVYWRLEASYDWTFLDSFYHCMMTATSVGLGDIAPETQAGRLFGVFHIILSVFFFGQLVQTAIEIGIIRKEASRKAALLEKEVRLREELRAPMLAGPACARCLQPARAACSLRALPAACSMAPRCPVTPRQVVPTRQARVVSCSLTAVPAPSS